MAILATFGMALCKISKYSSNFIYKWLSLEYHKNQTPCTFPAIYLSILFFYCDYKIV